MKKETNYNWEDYKQHFLNQPKIKIKKSTKKPKTKNNGSTQINLAWREYLAK